MVRQRFGDSVCAFVHDPAAGDLDFADDFEGELPGGADDCNG